MALQSCKVVKKVYKIGDFKVFLHRAFRANYRDVSLNLSKRHFGEGGGVNVTKSAKLVYCLCKTLLCKYIYLN